MHNKEKLVIQQCRTCYNATKGLRLLTKCAGTGAQKSYAELLIEVTNINIMEDSSQDLPKFICDSCSRKLRAAHAFIQQTHKVNERLMTMVIRHEWEETNTQLDCLEESQVDIQSCLEIKMEHGETVAVSEPQSEVALKLEEPEEFSPDYLNKEELRIKKDHEKDNVELDTLTLKETDVTKLDVNSVDNENTQDILNSDSTKTDDQIINNSKPLTVLLNNDDDVDDNNISSDNDYQDDNSLTDDMEWQNDQVLKKSSSNKKNAKKIAKSSNKSDEKIDKPPEEDDVAVPCTQCNKIFDNSKALARHQRTSHIPEDQKCTCPLCFRKFSRSCNMYTHMRTFHGPDTVPLIRKPSTEERTFQCDKCPRNYTKKKHLNIHIKNKHSQENECNDKKLENTIEGVEAAAEGTPTKPNKPKRYEVRSLCSICGSSFSSKTHLIVHMRRHTGERPFKCDLCDRAYPRISELTCHRRIHTGEKPFACKICGKTFRVSSKMTTHMRSHTDIRPYKCTQCERSFKYSKDLSIHFRIHTGERPYKCNICGSTFTQSNTLKAHRVKLGHMDNIVENSNNLV